MEQGPNNRGERSEQTERQRTAVAKQMIHSREDINDFATRGDQNERGVDGRWLSASPTLRTRGASGQAVSGGKGGFSALARWWASSRLVDTGSIHLRSHHSTHILSQRAAFSSASSKHRCHPSLPHTSLTHYSHLITALLKEPFNEISQPSSSASSNIHPMEGTDAKTAHSCRSTTRLVSAALVNRLPFLSYPSSSIHPSIHSSSAAAVDIGVDDLHETLFGQFNITIAQAA
jgi:hypothetical protein